MSTFKRALTPALSFVAATSIAVLSVVVPTASVQAQPVEGRMFAASVAPAAAGSAAKALPGSDQFTDGTDKKAAVDITDVSYAGASKAEPAAVSVFTNDTFAVGDSFTVYLNIDGDAAPDVAITGMYASEYGTYLMDSWTKFGKNIDKKNCSRMSINGKYADVSFSPNCFTGKTVNAFSVNVRTTGDDGADDHAPAFHKWSSKIDANI